MPNEQKVAVQSEPVEKVEPAPAPMPAVAPRKESVPRDRYESVLGSGVSIEGKMEGDGDVRIAGKFKGDIHIRGNLNIQKGAHLTAKINADAVTIEGEVDGTVVASGQVTLSESACAAMSSLAGTIQRLESLLMVAPTMPARACQPPENKPASHANFSFIGP